MTRGFRKTLKRFVPPGVVDAVGYAGICRKYLRCSQVLHRNVELKGRYAGRETYVIGNGPSLRDFDIRQIGDTPVITMNHFELHPDKGSVSIAAHCIGEPFSGPTWEDPKPMLEGVDAASYWLNADAIPYFGSRTPTNVHFYLPGVRKDSSWMTGSNLAGIALIFQSTAQMAIMVAMYLGFTRINLLGLDHDWLVTRGHSPHFYDEPDHLPKADLSRFTYTEMIRISLDLFETYAKISLIARANGTTIVNLSSTSYLDVFPTSPPAA